MKNLIACGVFTSLVIAAAASAAVPSTNPVDLEITAFTNLKYPAAADPIGKTDINDVPLDMSVGAFFEQHRADFNLLREASTRPVADWGDPRPEMSRVMTQLNASRNAVNLLWLKSRWDQKQGRPAEAVDDLLNSIAIGHHVGQKNLLVCQLVEMGCESGATERLAAILPSLPAEIVAAMPAKLDALPPRASFAAIMDGEREFGRSEMFKRLSATTDPVEQATAPIAVQQVLSLDPLYDAAKAAATQSPDEFDKALDAAVAKMPGNMFAKIMVPTFKGIRKPSAEVETRTAMLRTAIAISIDGPEAVNDSSDPFGDGAPFIRHNGPGGYTLQSHLVSRGKAVTLQVGQ